MKYTLNKNNIYWEFNSSTFQSLDRLCNRAIGEKKNNKKKRLKANIKDQKFNRLSAPLEQKPKV